MQLYIIQQRKFRTYLKLNSVSQFMISKKIKKINLFYQNLNSQLPVNQISNKQNTLKQILIFKFVSFFEIKQYFIKFAIQINFINIELIKINT